MLQRVLDESYAPEVRANVVLLTVARTVANACFRYAPVFLATIASGLDVSLGTIGVALAITELSGLLSPATALVVRRFGQRLAMVVGLCGVGVGAATIAASVHVVMFAVGVVVLAQSKVLFDLGLGTWVSGHVPYERRGRVIGLTETSWAFGLLLGVSTMGVITGLSDWRIAYVGAVVAVVVMAALVARRLEAVDSTEQTTAAQTARQAERTRRRPGSAATVLGAFGLMGASQCIFVTFGSWLEDSFDFGAVALGAVAFGLGAGELLASLTASGRSDRWGKEASAAAGAALMVPSAVVLAAWHDQVVVGLVLLAVAIAGFEFGIVSLLAVGTSLVEGAPAAGMAMLIGAGTLGRAAMTIPSTWLYESHGFTWPMLLAAGVAVLAVLALRVARWAAPPDAI